MEPMDNDDEVLTTDTGVETDVNETGVKTAVSKGAEVFNNGEKVEKVEGNEEQTATHTDKPELKNETEPNNIETELEEQRQAEQDAKEQITAKGLDWDALSKEYMENGSLSDKSMEALANAGFPKSLVDSYIRGMEATATQYRDAVFNLAGGEEEYRRMTDFVRSLGQSEVNAFNRAIQNADLAQLNNMFIGYKSRMVQRSGTSNPVILGNNSGGSQGGYANKNAMVKAMSDPRYGSDPEYTNEVQTRLMRSSFLNSN